MTKRLSWAVCCVVGALALSACGGGAKLNGKQGAAEALFTSMGPGNRAQSSPRLFPTGLGLSGIGTAFSATVNCPKGGTSTVTANQTTSGTSGVSQSLTITHNNCGLTFEEQGANGSSTQKTVVVNGSLDINQTVDVQAGSISQAIKGKLTFTGDINDFLNVDVTQAVSFTQMGATSGSVSVTLNGSLTTSSGTYTFTHEALTVNAGGISTHP